MSIDDSTIRIKQLLIAEAVIAENKNIQILSFTATLYTSDEILCEFSVTGTKFSESNKKAIFKIKISIGNLF